MLGKLCRTENANWLKYDIELLYSFLNIDSQCWLFNRNLRCLLFTIAALFNSESGANFTASWCNRSSIVAECSSGDQHLRSLDDTGFFRVTMDTEAGVIAHS